MASCSRVPAVAPRGPTASHQVSLLRYIGVKTLASPNLLAAAAQADLSESGCAQLVANILRDPLQATSLHELAQARVWFDDSGRTALTDMPKNGRLSAGFSRHLKAAGVEPSDFARLVRATNVTASLLLENAGPGTTGSVLPEAVPKDLKTFLTRGSGLGQRVNVVSRSIPAWRNAETYVAALLMSQGFEVEDTSRQNLGYDLIAANGAGKAFIEIKLVDWLGAPFTLTSNEHAVAREAGANYFVALVLRSRDEVRLEFISDPTVALRFERQCKQWAWECADYKLSNLHVIKI